MSENKELIRDDNDTYEFEEYTIVRKYGNENLVENFKKLVDSYLTKRV